MIGRLVLVVEIREITAIIIKSLEEKVYELLKTTGRVK